MIQDAPVMIQDAPVMIQDAPVMIQDAPATPLDTDRPTVSTRWVLPTGNSNERGLREARGLLRRTFSLPSILSQMCQDTRDHNPSRSPQSSDHPLGFVHSTCFLGCIYAVTQSHPATLHGIERNDPSPRSSPCDLLSSIPACVEAARTQRGGMDPPPRWEQSHSAHSLLVGFVVLLLPYPLRRFWERSVSFVSMSC